MRIVIDTGVLWRPNALEALRDGDHDLILPAVAYAERRRQLVRRGVAPAVLDQLLDEAGIMIEPFGRLESARVAELELSETAWTRLARDAFIRGHVAAGDVLWTTNPRDFLALGLSRNQIHAVA